MGATLSEPVTNKFTTYSQNDEFKVGASSMQGWRQTMEDAHTILLSTPDDESASYFGVFDGHGGTAVSDYLGRHLYKHIMKQHSYRDGDITGAIQQGFLEIDALMMSQMRNNQSGSTAVVVIIKDGFIYCGNVGDSRAIAVVNGSAVPLSKDHKPTDPDERRRINAAGGWIESNRVNGNLALSRALGDFNFKVNTNRSPEEQIITAFPDVTVENLSPEWDFIVIACDGIWDVMTNNEVGHFITKRIKAGRPVDLICEDLLDTCISPDCQMGGIGCDNMTVIIILFNREEKEEKSDDQMPDLL